MRDSYLTITNICSAELKVSNSKFMANAFPVKETSEILHFLKEIKKKYYDASHHPYAYRLGADKNNYKTSDDGEPSGSSGKPVLEAIDKHDLTDLIVIITRYFGGTKLGTGGLRRAYFEAADLCIRESKVEEIFITEKLTLEFEYKYMNAIMNLIETYKLKLNANNSNEKCILSLEVRLSMSELVRKDLVSITNGSIKIDSDTKLESQNSLLSSI